MLPISVLHDAQQPIVLPSLLEPVLAVGFHEGSQVAGCERASGFRTLILGRRLTLNVRLARVLTGDCGIRPGGAGSWILVLLG